MNEVIDKRLAEMMIALIFWVLGESFQDRLETCSIKENIVGNAISRSIERGRLDNPISEPLTKIVDTEETMHVMTNSIFGNPTFIAPVVGFVKCNPQEVLGELKASTTMNKFYKAGSGKNKNPLVAVSPKQDPRSGTQPSPNQSSDDKAESRNVRCKRKRKR